MPFFTNAVIGSGDDTALSAVNSLQSSSELTSDSLLTRSPRDASKPNAIAFVDSAIADVDTLIEGIDNATVVLIEASENGITQITETLSQYDELGSVHIFSHGSEGLLQLGNSQFDTDALYAEAAAVERWGDALTPTGDLLLYGCGVAAGEAGSDFISEISRITGADVAASVDVTGAGGDWILEASLGSIEADVAVSAEAQSAFADSLNILGAGGFESGSRTSGAWGWWNGSSQDRIVEGQGMNGSRAARLSSGQSGLGQVVSGSAGKTYRLTAHARTTSQGFSTFGIKFLDSNNQELGSIDIGQIRSRDWKVTQVAGRAPEGTAKVQAFGFKWSEDGETYLDNVSLQVDGEEALAPQPLVDAPIDTPIDTPIDAPNNSPTQPPNNTQIPSSNRQQVSVFLLGGQSNMVGLGRNNELPGNLSQPNGNVKIWQDSSRSFINLQPGFSDSFSGNGPEFGPELTFGSSIQGYNGKAVHLIKHATGSTNLVSDWDPDGANNREYDIFVERVDRALADLRSQNIDYSIDGMLWMQGEADAYSEAPANEYRANLTAFIRDMRSRYGGGMKFVIGQLHNSFDTAYDDTVRSAQYSVAAADGNTTIASTNGFGLYSDQVHYNTAGQISLGYSFANAVRG